jgi:hypothetical protein
MAYISTKPVAGDTEDNARIFTQQNFAALNTAWDVNHRPINEEEPGHSFLSFTPQGGPPTTSATQSALFGRAGVYGALNAVELCFRRLSDGDINEFTSAQTGDEGWFQLPSGILFKWKFGMVVAAAAAGEQTFTWNNAANFPAFSEIYQAYVYLSSPAGAGGTDIDGYAYTDVLTTTTVKFVTWQRTTNAAMPGIASAYRAHILAIGKGPGV